MEISIKENGNAMINGKEYIPRARIESDIEAAVRYSALRKIANIVLVSAAVIISFLIGCAVG